MKKYVFIAVTALGFLLTACTADSVENTYSKPQSIQKAPQFDSFEMYAKDGDSISVGEPVPPKPKG